MDVEKAAARVESVPRHAIPVLPPCARSEDQRTSSGGHCHAATDKHDLDEKSIQVDDLGSTRVASPVVLPIEVIHDEEHFIEGGWEGWSVIAGCFLIGAPTVGWNLLWGVFQAYHSIHLLRDTPDATISVVGAIQNTMMAAVAFVAGKLGDRFGYKRFIVAGCIIVFVGQFSAAWCKQFWSIFVTQGVLQGIGCGLTLPMVFAIPSQWFKRRRGLATGIVIAGAALGGAVSSLIVQAMLTRLGLHRTLLIYSFIQGVIMLIGCLLIKTRFPPSQLSETSRREIQWVNMIYLKDPIFWSFWVALAFFVLGYQNPFIFISVYTREKIPQLSSQQLASLPISIMNFSSAIGRTTVGLAADKIGFINAFILTSAISAFSQAVLWNLTTDTYAGVIVFSIIFGLTGPCYVSLTTPVAATLYGTHNLATLTGLLSLASLPGALSGPPIGGLILGRTGRNWHAVAGYSGMVQLVGMLCVLYARFKREPRIFARL